MLDLTSYLTTGEVVKRSGKVRWTICRAVKEGRLEAAAKLPGSLGAYLFHEDEVKRWIAASPAPYRRYGGE